MVRNPASTEHFAPGKKTAAQRPGKNLGRPGKNWGRGAASPRSGESRGVSGAQSATKKNGRASGGKKIGLKRPKKTAALRLGKNLGMKRRVPPKWGKLWYVFGANQMKKPLCSHRGENRARSASKNNSHYAAGEKGSAKRRETRDTFKLCRGKKMQCSHSRHRYLIPVVKLSLFSFKMVGFSVYLF